MKRFSKAALMLLAGGLLALPVQVLALQGPHVGSGTMTITCSNCHIPHASKGDRLWVETPKVAGATNWGANKIGQLCYSCHDGSTSGAANMGVYIYTDNSAHGPFHASIPPLPDWTASNAATTGVTLLNGSTLPYTSATSPLEQGSGQKVLQCTSCHFVHDNTDGVRPYLRTGASTTTRADLCIRCHKRGEIDTAGEQAAGNHTNSGYAANISLHPIKISAVTATQGANLLTNVNAAVGRVLTNASGWLLGGHLADGTTTGNIDCTSCHAVHGDETGGFGAQGEYKFPVNNFAGSYTTSPLCVFCHQLPVKTGLTDHPINSNAGKYPTTFPSNGGPNQGTAASPWPQGTGTNGNVVCSSCHDAHGGLPADASTNQGNTLTGRLRRQGGNTTDWCLSCHLNASPNNHHSHKQNLISGTNGAAMTSVISCGDCHGTTAGATAHQTVGVFFATRTFVAGNGNHANNSRWCNYCHNINPTDLEGSVAQSALATGLIGTNGFDEVHGTRFPWGHGIDRGEGSHVLGWDGSFVKVTTTTTYPMTASWANAFNPEAGSLDNRADNLSRYGAAGDGDMVCESCHNIIGNVGYNAAGNGSEGWKANLLLEAYKDDGAGNKAGANAGLVGARLCMTCHYTSGSQYTTGPGGTHQITGQTITARQDNNKSPITLITTPITGANASYADASGGPNDASYPADNTLDCDSCHRPHDASDGSTVTATTGNYTTAFTKGVDWILEESGASGAYSPTLCTNCHNY